METNLDLSSELDAKFNAAVQFIQLLPKSGPIKPSIDDKLATYGLFKQATIGPCNTKKPAVYHPIDRLKWNAWHALGDMSKEDAKKEYVRRFITRCEGNYEKYSKDLPEWLKDPRYDEVKSWTRENYTVFGVTHLHTSDGREHDIILVGKEIGLEMVA